MLRLFRTGLLLLLVQTSFADAIDGNSSDSLLHRSKRSLFAPNANCPDPVYLTQAQVAAWPGITVDTTQITILDDTSKLNLFKCSDDTFFVYTHLPTVMTRANWWLACGPTMSNGWRVRDAGGKNTAYGVIPVGCVKPTCTGLQLFDGSEFVLASYQTYQIVPNQPSLIGINQKFQFTCPVGSTIGFADSSATISLDASMKITCEAEGWWMRTSSNLNGQLLTAKVGCIKTIPALPPTMPTQCQTGITYFTPNMKMTSESWTYSATTDKAVAVNGQWALVCPTSSSIGYVDSANKVTYDSAIRITCESTGWWIKSASNAIGNALPSGLRVGCFLREKVEYKCASTNLQLFDGSEPIIVSNAAKYELVPTVPSTVAFVCPSGTTTAYAQLTGDIRLLVEPLSITCESAGWWVKSPLRVDGLLPEVKVGCLKELPSSAVTAPASTLPKQACGCWYERSTCRSCDSAKLFVLDGHGAMSARCTLGCGKGYELEGGENMLSCNGGSWIGSSRTGAIGVTVPQSGPFGYIITSCVPTTTVTTCSITPPTFDCLGCDKSKIISLTPTKSKTGCVLSCDTNYRILVLDTNQKVTRAQEVVAEQGGLFSVYPLGNVNGAIAMSSTVKFSCELATTTTEPVVLNPACTGLQLFDGSESIIAANLATYQFIPTIPSLVAGKPEFACSAEALVGYAQGDNKLSIEPLKITCESAGWWVRSSIPNRVDGPLGSVKIGCFKELPTSAVAAPASTVPKTACGCWYEPSGCKSCDLQKLTVLDGVGLSGRCTLGCAKDYVFEGGEMNLISCEAGYWFGSSRTVLNATVAIYGSFGYITTSCVPAPTPAVCPLQFTTFDCIGCDKSKVFPISSSKTKSGCVLACDKDYRLLVLDASGKVTRAQEAVTGQATTTVYPLGTVKKSISIASSGAKFSCEPVTTDIAAQVVLGTVPPPPVEPCGCPYIADVSNSAYDVSKLFVQNSGTNSCNLQCESGYRLAGAKSSASCKDGKWSYVPANSAGSSTTNGIFSCEAAPATCGTTFKIAPCQAGKVCNPNALIKIQGTKSNCILTCTRGYQLSQWSSDGAVPYHLMQEVYWDATAWSGAGGWKGVALGDSASLTHFNAPTVITVTCERYVSPAEAASRPPINDCGCPYYQDTSNPAYDMTKLFIQDTGTNKCTLQCDVGYRLTGARSSATCFEGKWGGFAAEAVRGSVAPDTFSCEAAPGATCTRKYTTNTVCNPGKVCDPTAVRAIKGSKSSCMLSCAKGYRLIWGSTYYQELWFGDTEGAWRFQQLGTDPAFYAIFNPDHVPSVNCERYVTPAEAARIPPDTEKRTCGCPYDFSGCPTCDWKQLFRIDGFLDNSGTCTLACAKGYMFEGGQVNLVTCKKGKGWIGTSRTTAGATVTVTTSDHIITSCVPVPTPATCAVSYSSFLCEKYCYPEQLIALSSSKSPAGCVLSCENGYRLIVHDANKKVTRAQEAVAGIGFWTIYALGDTQTSFTMSSGVVKFSCETATLTLTTLVPI